MEIGAGPGTDVAIWPKITGAHGSTIKSALEYETKRKRGRRARNLDAREKFFAESVLDLAGKGSHVLDVPCGTGRFSHIFTMCRRLTMLDMAPNMMAVAHNKLRHLDHVKILLGDIRRLPLCDNTVDVVFCMRFLHYIPDNETRLVILKEMARVCRKYIAFSFYNGECIRYQWRKRGGKHVRGQYIGSLEMTELCREAGLARIYKYPSINIMEQESFFICRPFPG
jgi:SAM-dependent methyltransferase